MKKFMVRHGDLLLERIASIPADAKIKKTNVLLEGEITGHSHRINGAGAAVLERGTELYVRVAEGRVATVTHQEHATIELPPGEYVTVKQREYNPFERAARWVQD